LEIAKNLNKKVTVITDNDGNFQNLDNKYAEYQTSEKIKISYSKDNSLRTLEYHLLSVNGREALNVIFNKSFQTDDEILNYMLSNKTECALAIFKITGNINFPYYIQDAI
jgi:hypothetical protein